MMELGTRVDERFVCANNALKAGMRDQLEDS